MYICMYSFHWIEFMLICNQTTGITRKKIHVCRDVLCSKSQCERVSYTTRKRSLVQVGKSRSMLFWSIMWFQNCFYAVKIHDGKSKLPDMYLRLKQWFILTEGLDSKLFLRGAFLYIHDTTSNKHASDHTKHHGLRQDLSQPLHSYEAQRETWAKKQRLCLLMLENFLSTLLKASLESGKVCWFCAFCISLSLILCGGGGEQFVAPSWWWKSMCSRWFNSWPFYPLVGGHLTFEGVTEASQKGHEELPGYL